MKIATKASGNSSWPRDTGLFGSASYIVPYKDRVQTSTMNQAQHQEPEEIERRTSSAYYICNMMLALKLHGKSL